MEKERIIEEIIRGKSLKYSEMLFQWVEDSGANREEYIRYKNLHALLQTGQKMDRKYVEEGYRQVKSRLNRKSLRISLRAAIKYAAVFLFALLGGWLMHSVTLNRDVAMNEIAVPNGNRSLISLPDGSQAWLTNGSKLVYPEHFEKGTRCVQLEGEAFFTVAHDSKKTFMVEMGRYRVRVLGTEFSVVAYPEDETVQVDLVSGEVHLDVDLDNGSGNYKSYELDPLHSLVLDKTSGKLSYSRLPDSFFNYWKNGVYEFKDVSFATLAKKIERIYGVKLIFEDDSIKQRTFTGTINIDDNIYTMMEVFKRASAEPFDYLIDRNIIHIQSEK